MNDDDHGRDGYLERYTDVAARDPAGATALLAGWLRTDPQPLFAELRERRPVLVTPGFTLVTRYTDVTAVLTRDHAFTVAAYAPRLDGALGGPVMLSRDATPLNWREKGLMQVVLAPEDAARVRDLAGRRADAALDTAAPGATIEAVGALFRHVPLAVCAEYFGFPGPDAATLSRWSRTIITDVTANLAGDPRVHAESVAAGAEMMAYLRELVTKRRGAPGDDVLGRLLRVEPPPGWDDERLAVNVAALLLGFVENAAGSMTHAVRYLLGDALLRAEAAEAARADDPARFDPYVWEALRFDPFLKMIARTCSDDHVLAGTPVPAGSLVLAAVASAMRDPDVVADPETFRVGRPAHAHLHFGHGPHACLGVHPGAVVIAETVRRLLRRPGVRLLPSPDGDVVRDRDVFPDRFVLELGERR
ncbi:Erythromycin C-12 hydroxylase [Actinomadura rubteroloni]|uniref:Erythromycin C-12 hydroxylase n=1 Tax=Actinomadura rubteroloni TaxID=1926885 RepID=A0A2P4ULT8_9ACTN|nr:cytochrome P450 [Actinomadura rubteroloni]POM26013.1 Erythromycin C-12 hydroxylase [Actinomadura rubteroloni]